jgi:hypothetical protein
MSDIDHMVVQLTQRLRSLETEISYWGTTNSQSNPGAVMELRDMRKQRAAVERALAIVMVRRAAAKKVPTDVTTDHGTSAHG